MGKNNKNRNIKSTAITVSFFAFLFILGYIGGSLMARLGVKNVDGFAESMIRLGLTLIIFFASYMIQIVLHEAGHLICGLLSGYEFISFRIGSLTLVNDEGKLALKKFNIKGTGGQCLMMPKADNYEECPYGLYNLGGVLMNVLVSTICALLYPLSNRYVALILISFVFSGILIFITNGIPMKISGIANDGYNVISIYKDKFMRYCFYTQLKVNGLLYKGMRFRDMDIEWFKVKENVDINNPLVTSLRVMEGNYYHDRLEFDKAEECYEKILDDTPKLIKLYEYEINCEILFYEILKGNMNKVSELYTKELKKYIKATGSYVSRKRLMYAYELLVEKDKEKADKLLVEFEKLKSTYPAKGEILSEEDVMKFIKSNFCHSL